MSELDIQWSATKHECSSCGELLNYTEEVFSLSVVSAVATSDGTQFAPLLVGNDCLYEPCLFCLDCWETDKESLRELTDDVPPIEDDYAILECDMCGSGIRQEEVMAISTFGEIHRSQRQPNGDSESDTFVPMDDAPDVLCIVCVNRLDQDVVDELWDARVAQNEECEEGTFARCWRHGCSANGECEFKLEETG